MPPFQYFFMNVFLWEQTPPRAFHFSLKAYSKSLATLAMFSITGTPKGQRPSQLPQAMQSLPFAEREA